MGIFCADRPAGRKLRKIFRRAPPGPALQFKIAEGGLPVDLAEWNRLPEADAQRELLACCASPRWAASVARGRPYAGADAVLAAGQTALDGLDWADVRAALDAHPRIGERVDAAGREADWSRREQAG